MSEQSTMPAGRELDALIAEKVMGFQWRTSRHTGYRYLFPPGHRSNLFTDSIGNEPLYGDWDDHVRSYSTDITAAKAATDAMLKRGWTMDLESFLTTESEPVYHIRLQYLRKQSSGDGYFVGQEVVATAATEEEARSRAALMAAERQGDL